MRESKDKPSSRNITVGLQALKGKGKIFLMNSQKTGQTVHLDRQTPSTSHPPAEARDAGITASGCLRSKTQGSKLSF